MAMAYSLLSLDSETSVVQMIENAYRVMLACAFVPLAAGLYWKHANNTGAGLSILLGPAMRIAMEFAVPEASLMS